jgi:predicted small secreted protein
MKFMTTAILGLTIAFAVSACNTIEGAGEDIEAGGDAIEDAAE